MKKYLNQIIVLTAGVAALAGIFAWQFFKGEKISQTPEPASRETPTPSAPPKEAADTSDWRFYSNELFNFELEHPVFLDMKYESVFEPTDITKKKVETIVFGEEPFKIWLVINAVGILPTSTEANLIEEENIKVGGIETIRKIFKGKENNTISALSFKRGDFAFSMWAEIAQKEEENLKIFDTLLSTFKFLE